MRAPNVDLALRRSRQAIALQRLKGQQSLSCLGRGVELPSIKHGRIWNAPKSSLFLGTLYKVVARWIELHELRAGLVAVNPGSLALHLLSLEGSKAIAMLMPIHLEDWLRVVHGADCLRKP